ncbi:MAG: response regulator, partial [Candidatus Gastranaerophilaceae bacterium]
MSKILILSDKSQLTEDVSGLLQEIGYIIKIAYSENEAFEIIPDFQPDIALVNTSCIDLNISTICKRLKMQGHTNDIQIILVTSEDTSSEEVMVGADGYITRPFNNNILIATINAHLRIKKLLDILYTNNSELAKSLYQLNVLYNTSSQLAGTLNKKKLIDIMSEGLEKSVSFSL